jgi:DNA-binding response OmpR family regulator
MDRKKILVVDDEENILKTISDLLLANGYEVMTAKDGKEGIEKAHKGNPDLILLDIMMPKISGLELLKKIKSSERSAHIPIIILSAKSDLDTLNEAMWNYAEKYITKPYDPEELLTSIKSSLNISFS